MDEKKSPLPPGFTEIAIQHKSKGELILPDTEVTKKKRTPNPIAILQYCGLVAVIFLLAFSAVYYVMSLETKTPNVIKIETEEYRAKPLVQPKDNKGSLKDTSLSDIRKNINLQVVLNGEPAISGNFDGNENLTEIFINIAKPDDEFKFPNDLSNQNSNKEKIDNFDLSHNNNNIGYYKPIVKIIDTYEIRKIPFSNPPSMFKPNSNFPFIDDFLDSIFGFPPTFNNNENKNDSPTTTKQIVVNKVKKDKKNTTSVPKNSNNDKQVFPHSIFKDFDNIFDIFLENKIPSTINRATSYRDEPTQKTAKLESNMPIFDVVTFNNKPFSNPFFNSFQKPQSDKFRQYDSKENDESINKFINSILGIPNKTKSNWHSKDSQAKEYNEYNKDFPRYFDEEIPNIVLYENTFTPPCHIGGGKCPKHKNSQKNGKPISFPQNQSNIESEESKEASNKPTETPTTETPTTTTKQDISPISPTSSTTTKQISNSIQNNIL